MSLFSSFIFPSNPFLSGIDKSALGLEFQLDQNIHTFSAFHFTVYCTEQFCQHQSRFQNSDTLLYTSMVNLVRIQQSLLSTETSPFFLYQFLFLSHMFFSFAWRFLKVLALHQNFIFFSQHVVIFYLGHACAHAKKALARRVILHAALIWGERRDSPPRRYIGYPIYHLFKTIYRLGNILSGSYKQVISDSKMQKPNISFSRVISVDRYITLHVNTPVLVSS